MLGWNKKHDGLRIFMKSGNVIEIDEVTDWSIEYRGDEITKLKVTQTTSAKNFLRVGSVALGQIEALVEVKS